MRYLVPCAILLLMAAANAETVTVNSQATQPVSNSSSVNIQQATQSVARRLITLLGLSSVSENEQASISLKDVVIRALNEDKPMSEIRLAADQAVSEIKVKALSVEVPATTINVESTAAGVQPVNKPTQAEVAINPAEVTIDPETGNMMAIVLPGESIFRLAQRVYGKKNGRKYIAIFAANTDKIKDINVVVQGQALVMP